MVDKGCQQSCSTPEAAEAETNESVSVAADSNWGTDGVEEPSPEFISLVAKRVVEQLSDRVIRDIAEDVVEIAHDVEGIEKDIDEIQEDVGEIAEDMEHIEKDIDEIQEDVDEMQEEAKK